VTLERPIEEQHILPRHVLAGQASVACIAMPSAEIVEGWFHPLAQAINSSPPQCYREGQVTCGPVIEKAKIELI
jgi:hypothetical protein